MTRTPLSERVLPQYTRGEDIANMVTHIIGGAIGIAALVGVLVVSIAHKNVWGLVSGVWFAFCMIALYTVSSVYHGLRPGYGKKVMQVIDHCTIYLLIVGTYTPVLLCGVRPQYPVAAWVVFGVEWLLVAFATTFTAIDHNRYSRLSMVCYIGMGWCIVLLTRPAIRAIGLEGFLFLLGGGVSYTVGAVLYGLGKRKHPIFHTIFHVFVDVGSILQAICIIGYVI